MLMLAKTAQLRQRRGGGAMTFVAAGTAVSGTNTADIFVPYYAGLAANDIAFIFATVHAPSMSSSNFAMLNFTQVADLQFHTSGEVFGSQIFWKKLTGSESGTEQLHWAGTAAVNDGITGVMIGIRGANIVSPYEGWAANVGQGSTTTSASLTTVGPNRLALRFGADFASTTGTPPTGWTELLDITPLSSNRVDSKEIATASTISATSYSIGGSAQWAVQTLAMIPGS